MRPPASLARVLVRCSLGRLLTRPVLGSLVLGSLQLACQPSAQPAATAAGARTVDVAWEQPSKSERHLDERVVGDNIKAQLGPYIESVGAGFGPGYQPTGFVSVSGAGRVLYAQGFGFADQSTQTPNTADTSFRIGAVTKQFTAAAILRLAAEGKLSLEDTIAKHLPEYPQPGAAITIHQLLSHTAGLPNYMGLDAVVSRRTETFTPRQLLELFWKEPLEFPPGSDFRYSESGYVVLGAIIEHVTGQTYAAHMQRDIFARFGLEHTSFGEGEEKAPSAHGYSASENGAPQPAEGINASILYAAGGIRSTANDLLRWHDALQTGGVLDPPQLELFSRPVRENYAYGWFVREAHGLAVTSHAGTTPGFGCEFVRVPELDLALVVLTNSSAVDAHPIADAALEAALGEKLEPRKKPTTVELDSAIVPRLTGTYRLSDAAAETLKAKKIPKQALQAMRSVRIIEDQGKLSFKPVGQAAVPMIATGPGSFVLLGGKAKILVVLDPDGSPVTRLTLEQGPLQVEYTRRARVRGKPQDNDEPEIEPGH